MVWIHAGRIIAFVANPDLWGNIASINTPCGSAGCFKSMSRPLELPIAIGSERPFPQPASRIGLWNEQSFKPSHVRFGNHSLPVGFHRAATRAKPPSPALWLQEGSAACFTFTRRPHAVLARRAAGRARRRHRRSGGSRAAAHHSYAFPRRTTLTGRIADPDLIM